MSTTYIAVIVSLLATFLPKFGINAGTEELTNIVQSIVIAASGIWILVKRYKQGDITPIGRRK